LLKIFKKSLDFQNFSGTHFQKQLTDAGLSGAWRGTEASGVPGCAAS
jgi:hypothetical protein